MVQTASTAQDNHRTARPGADAGRALAGASATANGPAQYVPASAIHGSLAGMPGSPAGMPGSHPAMSGSPAGMPGSHSAVSGVHTAPGASARLLLRIGAERLDVVSWRPAQQGELEYAWAELPAKGDGPAGQAWLVGLEEAVYDRPWIVEATAEADVRVTVLVDERRSLTVTGGGCTTAEAASLLSRAYPGGRGEAMVSAAGPDCVVAWLCDDRLAAFLRRTFTVDVSLRHPLAELSRWAAADALRTAGGAGLAVAYAHFREGAVDVAVCRGGRTLSAASHAVPSAGTTADERGRDAAYYVLASLRQATGDAGAEGTAVVKLCGRGASRAEAARELGRFVRRVEPVIFPSELFRSGRAAMQAPFDLMLSNL